MAGVRVLIIQTAFLGDVVLATALVESLATAYPEAELHMLVRHGNQGVLEGHPKLAKVWIWDKRRKYADLWRLLQKVRSARFDAVVCVQRFTAMGALTALSGARVKSGFGKNPLSVFFTHRAKHLLPDPDGRHEVERNHALLAPFGQAMPALPRLYPTPIAVAQAAPYQKKRPYVCLAPASVWATKQWPAGQWARLLRLLVAQDPARDVYVLGGLADAALAQAVIDEAGLPARAALNLAGKLSLMGSAALLVGAQRLYANDSGPIHLATAVGCPTTAVFCSTVPAFGFGPLAPGSVLVQETTGLPCRPCGLHGHKTCPQGHFLCGRSVSAEAVIAG